MTDGTPERLDLGVGGVSMLVPPGWEPIGVDRSVLEEEDAEPTGELVAAGVAQPSKDGFTANVIVLRGDGALDVPSEEFDDGLLWHDSWFDGPVQRVTMGVREFLLTSIVTVRLWAVLGGEPLLIVATIDSDALTDKWPGVLEVLRSLFEGVDVPWTRWFR